MLRARANRSSGTFFDGLQNHAVLLHRRQSADPLVVREGLVVRGDKAQDLLGTCQTQGLDPEVAIEKEISVRVLRMANHHRRLDHPYLRDRGHNLRELLRSPHLHGHGSQHLKLVDAQLYPCRLERPRN